eukprot:4781871-Prymnesium_polylepis.1
MQYWIPLVSMRLPGCVSEGQRGRAAASARPAFESIAQPAIRIREALALEVFAQCKHAICANGRIAGEGYLAQRKSVAHDLAKEDMHALGSDQVAFHLEDVHLAAQLAQLQDCFDDEIHVSAAHLLAVEHK